jgi:hypothetical protein
MVFPEEFAIGRSTPEQLINALAVERPDAASS